MPEAQQVSLEQSFDALKAILQEELRKARETLQTEPSYFLPYYDENNNIKHFQDSAQLLGLNLDPRRLPKVEELNTIVRAGEETLERKFDFSAIERIKGLLQAIEKISPEGSLQEFSGLKEQAEQVCEQLKEFKSQVIKAVGDLSTPARAKQFFEEKQDIEEIREEQKLEHIQRVTKLRDQLYEILNNNPDEVANALASMKELKSVLDNSHVWHEKRRWAEKLLTAVVKDEAEKHGVAWSNETEGEETESTQFKLTPEMALWFSTVVALIFLSFASFNLVNDYINHPELLSSPTRASTPTPPQGQERGINLATADTEAVQAARPEVILSHETDGVYDLGIDQYQDGSGEMRPIIVDGFVGVNRLNTHLRWVSGVSSLTEDQAREIFAQLFDQETLPAVTFSIKEESNTLSLLTTSITHEPTQFGTTPAGVFTGSLMEFERPVYDQITLRPEPSSLDPEFATVTVVQEGKIFRLPIPRWMLQTNAAEIRMEFENIDLQRLAAVARGESEGGIVEFRYTLISGEIDAYRQFLLNSGENPIALLTMGSSSGELDPPQVVVSLGVASGR